MQDFFQIFWDVLVENRERIVFVFIFTLVTSLIVIPLFEKLFLIITLITGDIFSREINLVHSKKWENHFGVHLKSLNKLIRSSKKEIQQLQERFIYSNGFKDHVQKVTRFLNSYEYLNRILLLNSYCRQTYIHNTTDELLFGFPLKDSFDLKSVKYYSHIIWNYERYNNTSFENLSSFEIYNFGLIEMRISKYLETVIKKHLNNHKFTFFQFKTFLVYLGFRFMLAYKITEWTLKCFWIHANKSFVRSYIKETSERYIVKWHLFLNITLRKFKNIEVRDICYVVPDLVWSTQKQKVEYRWQELIKIISSSPTMIDHNYGPNQLERMWVDLMEEFNPSILWILNKEDEEAIIALNYGYKINEVKSENFEIEFLNENDKMLHNDVNGIKFLFNKKKASIEYNFKYLLYNKENAQVLFDFYVKHSKRRKLLFLGDDDYSINDGWYNYNHLLYYSDLQAAIKHIHWYFKWNLTLFQTASNGYFLTRSNFLFVNKIIRFFDFYIKPLLFILSFIFFFVLESLYLEVTTNFVNQYYTLIVTILNVVL